MTIFRYQPNSTKITFVKNTVPESCFWALHCASGRNENTAICMLIGVFSDIFPSHHQNIILRCHTTDLVFHFPFLLSGSSQLTNVSSLRNIQNQTHIHHNHSLITLYIAIKSPPIAPHCSRNTQNKMENVFILILL